MSELYLIGGTPRCGKSHIAEAFVRANPVASVSTDAMRDVIRSAVDEEKLNALTMVDRLLFDNRDYRQFIEEPSRIIDLQNAESLLVWKGMQPYITHEYNNGHDLLVEGIAVTPQAVATLGIAHNAVFVGNQSDQHVDAIVANAQNDPTDWMNRFGLTEDEMNSFAIFMQSYSQHMQFSAQEHGYTYIEMDDDNFHDSVGSAVMQLLER